MKAASTILLILAYVLCLSVAVFSRPSNPWYDLRNEILAKQRQQSSFESQRLHSTVERSQIPVKRLTAYSKCMLHPGPHCKHFFTGKRSATNIDLQHLQDELNKRTDDTELDFQTLNFLRWKCGWRKLEKPVWDRECQKRDQKKKRTKRRKRKIIDLSSLWGRLC